jgi:hypothetical protein
MKRLVSVLSLVVLGTLTVACGGPSSASALPRVEVELISAGGLGDDVTRFEVWSDGLLVRCSSIAVLGCVQAQANAGALETLRAAVNDNAFRQLGTQYGDPHACCDLSTFRITAFRYSATQQVTVYGGPEGIPAPFGRALGALQVLEASIG